MEIVYQNRLKEYNKIKAWTLRSLQNVIFKPSNKLLNWSDSPLSCYTEQKLGVFSWTYIWKLLNGVHVDLILFHFFPVPDGLFNLGWIYVFWPTTLHMVYTTTLCLKPLCIHLTK